jgi:hypothetical protein
VEVTDISLFTMNSEHNRTLALKMRGSSLTIDKSHRRSEVGRGGGGAEFGSSLGGGWMVVHLCPTTPPSSSRDATASGTVYVPRGSPGVVFVPVERQHRLLLPLLSYPWRSDVELTRPSPEGASRFRLTVAVEKHNGAR